MDEPVPGAPSDNTTMTEIIRDYELAGFDAPMSLGADGRGLDGIVRCGTCGAEIPPSEMVLHSLRRVEGASDPADMAAVAAVACPTCGARGVVVARFGPEATPDDQAFLLGVRDGRGTGELPPASAPGENRY
jgi:DNA-directed RNA polymerase subunit RPC12/RpoP